ADLFDIQLEIAVVADDIPVYFDKILLLIICDPLGIRIPHLPVQYSCFVLKEQIVVWLPIPCLSGTFPFAEINIPYRLTFMQSVNISHFFPLSIDRKSTRLNSSHVSLSYAVFCLKEKTG